MKRILGFIFLMLIPGMISAQTATPTIDPYRSGDAIKVLYSTMTTVLPTAVPTAFITPAHVVNTAKKFQKISVVNNSDCDVVISYDGINDHDILPSKSASGDDLAADSRYHQGSIYLRGQSACTAGNVYVTGRY